MDEYPVYEPEVVRPGQYPVPYPPQPIMVVSPPAKEEEHKINYQFVIIIVAIIAIAIALWHFSPEIGGWIESFTKPPEGMTPEEVAKHTRTVTLYSGAMGIGVPVLVILALSAVGAPITLPVVAGAILAGGLSGGLYYDIAKAAGAEAITKPEDVPTATGYSKMLKYMEIANSIKDAKDYNGAMAVISKNLDIIRALEGAGGLPPDDRITINSEVFGVSSASMSVAANSYWASRR